MAIFQYDDEEILGPVLSVDIAMVAIKVTAWPFRPTLS